ncbi:MAG: cytidine deaminase [Rhizobiales bacterium 65-9]|nr:cytidine deaminase [Hyphomicrobiales bacterium]OJY37352.1 MAG: cytidine deaminase [Rhizobiales bacterium 65-9]
MSDAALDALFDAARAIRERAYAPYSRYKVGAAIRATDGRIFSGCNVENAAYPVGTCAEAAAIAAMIAAGANRIAVIAVIGSTDDVCTPCGGCRQRIREFAAPDALVAMADARCETRIVRTLDALLPLSFGPDHLPAPQDRGTPHG